MKKTDDELIESPETEDSTDQTPRAPETASAADASAPADDAEGEAAAPKAETGTALVPKGESGPTPIQKNDPGQPPIPRQLPLLPLRADVSFPGVIIPLVVGREKGIRLIDDVLKKDRYVGLVTQKDANDEEPTFADLYPTICVASVLKMLKFPDGSTRIVAEGLRRATLLGLAQTDPYQVGQIELIEDVSESGDEMEALVLSARRLLRQLVDRGGQIPEELQVAAMNTHEPGPFCDLLASGLDFSTDEKHLLLAEANVRERLKRLSRLLRRQVDMQDLTSKIQGEVSVELSKAQREQFLRQQLRAIKRELGESDEDTSDANEFYERLDTLKLPESAEKEARRELDRMAMMHPSSPEYHVIRTYLDTMLSMPWNESTEDRLDLRRAKRILDKDHYGLTKVKQRILEYLSVRKLKADMRGPILCFVGPPGVGKTSLGKSIARALGRKFIRISLGGVHDEAEIRGHRRTYIGAMPGRIIQGIRRVGSNNPVFMLDEIDKLSSDFRGDPASALLEVLDPEQNNSFRDHYLDVEFDLSRVNFICTANVLSTIPSALLDRMEVLELSGYSEEEKLAIANAYLVPKQLEQHGITAKAATFTNEGLRAIINSFTREAGLRNLEREIASVCRKIAHQHALGQKKPTEIDARKVENLLGAPKFHHDPPELDAAPGIAHGLAWTPVGGDVLTIESIQTPGKESRLKLTGSLGDVMKESAHAAFGYLQAHADKLRLEKSFLESSEIHIHVPAGAISKDGPSAGVALTASLLSLAANKPLRTRLAMTGEITLSGRILPVGGIREKLLAARREGFTNVILPFLNEKDIIDLPKEVKSDLELVFVKHMDEVVPHLFAPAETTEPAPDKPKGRSRTARSKPTDDSRPDVYKTPPACS